MSKPKQGKRESAKKKEIEFISVKSPRSSKIGEPPTEPKTGLVIAIFALVTMVFFFGHLFGDAYLWEDFTEQFLPFQIFAARSFADGTVPHWNPYTFAGMPFFADLQNGFYYPGHILMYILSGGTLGVWLAQFIIVLHYFIAMVGMWRLGKEFNLTGWGRMFAGITYGLSGMLVAHMIHPNMLYHMAFFPLIVAWFHKGIVDRSLKHSLLSGLTLGLVMLSGHPQMALFIIFFLFCLTVFLGIRAIRSDDESQRKTLPMALGGALLTVLVGVGIFAVQFLPSQELADMSRRSEMTYQESLDGSLEPKQLVTLVTPKVFGVVSGETPEDLPFWLRGGGDTYYFWETVVFFGIVALILAALGLASQRLGPMGWFLFGMGILGLLYALGDSFFIHPILGKLPFFNSFRVPTRMAIYLTLGASLLAGVGLDRVIRSDEHNDSLTQILWVVGGVVVLIGLLTASRVLPEMFGAPPMVIDAAASTGVTVLLIAIPTILVCFLGLRRKMPAMGAATALIILGAIDLFSFGVSQNTSPTNPMVQYQASDSHFHDFKANPPDDIFRVQMRGVGDMGGAMLMQRNQGPFSRIMLVEGYNPLLLQRIYPPAPTIEESMELLNVKYAVAIDTVAGRLAYAERSRPYPYAWMAFDANVLDTAALKRAMESGTYDLKRTALLEEEPPIKPAGAGSGTVKVTSYDLNRITLSANADAAGILVLSEIYYPAWKAYVDGEPTELLRTDWSLRGVALPAGEHTVELRYESDAYGTGFWISLISFLAAVGGIVFLHLRGRKSADASDRGPKDTSGEEE